MKTLVIAFKDELSNAVSLIAQTSSVQAEEELWVLGGIGDFPQNKICASCIVELNFTNEIALQEPLACAQAVYEHISDCNPELIITSSGIRGDELAAQLSVLLDCACVLGARAINSSGDGFAISKSVYAGNLTGEFFCNSGPLIISLMPNGSDCGEHCMSIEKVSIETDIALPECLSDIEYCDTKQEFSLSDARVVLAAGRGVGKANNFKALDELAGKMGAVLGGSRPTVCDGKLPADRLIGISGSRVSPELCIAFGVSGAAAFMAGVEGSRRLVAINRDADALIFEGCDFGIVADCAEFAAALSDLLGHA